MQKAVLDLRPRLWRGEEKRKLLKEVQVFKAHRRVYHSALGSRVIKKKKKFRL